MYLLASYFSLRVLVISCSSRAGHVQLRITWARWWSMC
jgi:hypothetical protein